MPSAVIGPIAELAPDAVLRADVIAVDDVSQAREEAGDLIMAGDAAWSRVVPLADIVVGRARVGRVMTL
ncbi:hypothetical protein [Vulcanisaeta distributa]|uniref:hypothetical protein n=1 Tax=Vulcanisaeta distributa TaxID=164451 RepID=UPI000A62DCB1|nr:hypothetical protein [Vulcanisaeta distributa]